MLWNWQRSLVYFCTFKLSHLFLLYIWRSMKYLFFFNCLFLKKERGNLCDRSGFILCIYVVVKTSNKFSNKSTWLLIKYCFEKCLLINRYNFFSLQLQKRHISKKWGFLGHQEKSVYIAALVNVHPLKQLFHQFTTITNIFSCTIGRGYRRCKVKAI